MKVIALGTGTSLGVPLIGCKCEACLSNDPRDKRLRSSIYIEIKGVKILVDVGPDFRQQFFNNKLESIDHILFTHEHNDHVVGIDELRAINFIQKKSLPLYAESNVLESIKTRFHYALSDYPGVPKIELNTIDNNDFIINNIRIKPIRVMHGRLPILGFRIDDFAYITDASKIEPSELLKLKGLDTLILNALRIEKHFSHYNLKEAVEMIKEINPKRAFLTHISHNMGPTRTWEPILPPFIKPLDDNMVISI